MASLFKFFFGSLPGYFKQYDTYKDGNSRGFLERYLGVFQQEAEEIVKEVGELKTAFLAKSTKASMLDFISGYLGTPPLLSNSDEGTFRGLLNSIIWVYKFKGTLKGLQLYFKIWGLSFSLESTPHSFIYFDSEYSFDSGVEYDNNCYWCLGSKATISPITSAGADLLKDSSVEDRIINAIVNLAPLFLFPLSLYIEYTYVLDNRTIPLSSSTGKLLVIT